MATTESSSKRRRLAHPDWRHLPAPALLCVCRHLSDLAAFFAFAGTCREWRDVANLGKKAFMVSQPPLLCTIDGERFYSPVNRKCYKNHRVASVVRVLMGTIGDVSQGYLVIKADCALGEKKLVLLNPFTQHRVDLPRLFLRFVSWVVLTAPPTSPNCVVVVCSNTWLPHGRCTWDPRDDQMSLMWRAKQFVKYTRPGDAGWTPFAPEISFLGIYYKPVVSSDGKVYAWALRDHQLELVVMEFPHGEEPKLTRLRTFAFAKRRHLYVVCLAEPGISGGGADQHRVLFVRASFMIKDSTFEIYPLDDAAASEQQQQAVLQKKSGVDHMLGGRALVMDHYNCVAADNPAGWGGRAGDVYFSDGISTGAWRLELRDFAGAGAVATAASSHYYAPWPGYHRGCYDMAPLWLLPADTCS